MSLAMGSPRFRWSAGGLQGHRDGPGSNDRPDPVSSDLLEGALDVIGPAGEAEAPRIVGSVRDVPAGTRDGLVDRPASGLVARDVQLHERELELEVRGMGEIADLEDLDEPLELGQDLAEVALVAPNDDRHPRAAGFERGRDRQGFDVERARPEQPGDAV